MHFGKGRNVTSPSSRRRSNNSKRWRPIFAACRMRTTNCGNTFSACNRSFSSRRENLLRHHLLHHAGGETSNPMMPSRCPITEHTIAVARRRSLPMSPHRARLRRVARGASTSIICARGIANTPRIERPSVALAINLTHRRRSESRKIELVPNFMCSSRHRGRRVASVWLFVGGSLFGCCCWPGAAAVLIGHGHTLPALEKMFTLHYRGLKGPRGSLSDHCQALSSLLYFSSLRHRAFTFESAPLHCPCVAHITLRHHYA